MNGCYVWFLEWWLVLYWVDLKLDWLKFKSFSMRACPFTAFLTDERFICSFPYSSGFESSRVEWRWLTTMMQINKNGNSSYSGSIGIHSITFVDFSFASWVDHELSWMTMMDADEQEWTLLVSGNWNSFDDWSLLSISASCYESILLTVGHPHPVLVSRIYSLFLLLLSNLELLRLDLMGLVCFSSLTMLQSERLCQEFDLSQALLFLLCL